MILKINPMICTCIQTIVLLGDAIVTLQAVVVPHTKARGEEVTLLCK